MNELYEPNFYAEFVYWFKTNNKIFSLLETLVLKRPAVWAKNSQKKIQTEIERGLNC